jgi:hypothetical protein
MGTTEASQLDDVGLELFGRRFGEHRTRQRTRIGFVEMSWTGSGRLADDRFGEAHDAPLYDRTQFDRKEGQ